MADSAAALLDERLRPPRQGDSDEGRALLLDAPAPNSLARRCWPWPTRSSAGSTGGPGSPADAGSSLIGALAARPAPDRRPARAAAVALRRRRDDAAAHDRSTSRDLVPVRRRSARLPEHRRARPRGRAVRRGPLRGRRHPRRSGHLLLPRRARLAVLLPVDHRAQHGGARRPEPVQRGRPVHVGAACAAPGRSKSSTTATSPRWTAEHDGYASLDPPVLHRRSVLLDRASRSIDIIDEIDGGSHDIRLAFHLGPEVQAELDGSLAILRWPAASGPAAARLELSPGLRWSLHRGRDRSHPRLVFSRPRTSRPRLQPHRPRAMRARHPASHAAGVPRSRSNIQSYRLPAGRIMGSIRTPRADEATEIQAEAR